MSGEIPVLWFDSRGYGPDELALEIQPFKAELDGAIPASLGLRVRAGHLVIGTGATMVDGGFNLGRDAVVELHRQLGDWLDLDLVKRPAGCLCTWEMGDSPCPVHGDRSGE